MSRASRRQTTRALAAGAGVARLALGFLAGVVFALVPLFFSAGRGPGAPSVPGAPATGEDGAPSAPAAVRFVSRLTYALHEVPEDLPGHEAVPPPLQFRPIQDELGRASRVANPKPIVASPLAPRDTTRGIDDERRRGEYRQPAHSQPRSQARFVDGRDLFVASGVKTAEVTAGAARGAAAEHLDIESRLAATREWLFAAANTTYTIQVAAATTEDQLRHHLRALSAVLDPNRTYIFRSTAHGRQTIKVVYGEYIERAAAVEALSALPPTVALNRPTLRTVKGIKAEITRKAAS
jgi:hypothetical protein